METPKLQSLKNDSTNSDSDSSLEKLKLAQFEIFKNKSLPSNIGLINMDKVLVEIFKLEVPRSTSEFDLLVPDVNISSTLDVANYVPTKKIVDIYLYPYAKVLAIGESLKDRPFFENVKVGDIVRISMSLMVMTPNPAYEDYLATLNERPKKYQTAPSQYLPGIERYKDMKYPLSALKPTKEDDYIYLLPSSFIDATTEF
jgi:hypothetical protein